MGRSSKDRRDIFYRLAKEEGWRARSAYKLLHMDYELQLLSNVSKAVDLCAAPGSWSQVLAQALKPLENEGTCIVAVDIQTMAPIPGVECFKGDITFGETADKIIEKLGNSKADIVVCDGAPDVTGYHDFDEHLQSDLFMAALKISVKVLATNGTFVAKIFRSSKEGVQWLFSNTQIYFKDVMIAKPRSSRSSSVEAYIVGRQFEFPVQIIDFMFEDTLAKKLPFSTEQLDMPRRTCGNSESFDSDTNYPLNILENHKYEFSIPPPNTKVLSDGYSTDWLPPVQPPIHPPYEEAVRLRKAKKLGMSKTNEVEAASKENQITINLAFGGGAENLVRCGKEVSITYPESKEYAFTLEGVLNYIKEHFIMDRPELFIKDGDVRPGILVLVNDTDWEILDKLQYQVQDNDSIAFISTLHGG